MDRQIIRQQTIRVAGRERQIAAVEGDGTCNGCVFNGSATCTNRYHELPDCIGCHYIELPGGERTGD
jgi:hypothetical protein